MPLFEKKLEKLKKLSEVDVKAQVTSRDPKTGLTSVSASVTKFDSKKLSQNGAPSVIKTVSVSAEGETLHAAQEKALSLAEELLGEV